MNATNQEIYHLTTLKGNYWLEREEKTVKESIPRNEISHQQYISYNTYKRRGSVLNKMWIQRQTNRST